MSCNGGSHPRINTLGRMTRAESGPDLRYEMTCGGVGGGGGGGGGGTSRMYYSRRCTVNDQNSDGYWWVPACRRLTQSWFLGQGGAPPPGQTGKPRSRPRKVLCPRSRKRRTGCPAALLSTETRERGCARRPGQQPHSEPGPGPTDLTWLLS